MTTINHVSLAELENGLDHIKASPSEAGRVEHIVRRPEANQREVLDTAELDTTYGLKGDCWFDRGNRKSPDGQANIDQQLTLMNVRVVDAIARDRDRWALAGDQFFVDFDLSDANLPPGTRLGLGEAIIEVTAEPHLGCRKFSDRFGKDSVMFVNSAEGKQLNLRGVNAKVIEAGRVSVGDTIALAKALA